MDFFSKIVETFLLTSRAVLNSFFTFSVKLEEQTKNVPFFTLQF